MIGALLHDRFEITAAIGQGAMGEVYRATDRQTGGDVAVKILVGQYAFDADMVERFRREGEALQQLRHPNIVGLVDTFQHERHQVIVLEYVPGGNLHSLLKREAPLDLPRVRQIALDLCDALIRAHRLNIVHRDIKPENVLMAEDGTPRLTDFGVARLVGDATRLTGTGTQIGTPYYMSPEAWEGETLDARSDIWSLGIMLYEMLSGQVPFGGETMAAVMNKVLTAPLPNMRALRPEISQDWVQLLSKMLIRDRAKRYQSMRQVAADLEEVALAEPPEAPQKAPRAPKPKPAAVQPPVEPQPRAARRPVWAWAAAGVFLLAFAGVALLAAGIISFLTAENPLPGSNAATSPPEATAAPTSSVITEAPGTTYVVQAGDTLNGIANVYGVTVQDLMEVNGITDPNSLREGQVLIIPLDRAGTPWPATASAASLGPTATAEWLWDFFYWNNVTWSTQAGSMAWALSGETLIETRDPYWTWMWMPMDADARDLMLGAEITWESDSTDSAAGCGFVFRLTDAVDDYYVGRIGRDGTAFLQVVIGGEGQPDLASGPAASIRTANGATNTLIVTARGPYLTMSVNGEMVIALEDDTLQGGLAAPLVSNTGGQRTECVFNNGGLWVMPPD